MKRRDEMRRRVSLQAFFLLASVLVLVSSSPPQPRLVPQEAYDSARVCLQRFVKHFQRPESQGYVHSAMKLEKADDLAEARLGVPFEKYIMSSSQLQGIVNIAASDYLARGKFFEASDLLAHAKFICYCFPVIIRNQYHGVMEVPQFQGKWTCGAFSGKEEIFDYILQRMDEHRDNTDNLYSLVLLDSDYVFAFTKISKNYYIKPANYRAIRLFGNDSHELAFEYARRFLIAYVKGQEHKQ